MAAYHNWVEDKEDAVVLDGDGTEALRTEMAAAHLSHTFSHQQYTNAWQMPPASVPAYRSIYADTDQSGDFLKKGMWARGLPVLRPMPGFSSAATVNTDLPSCSHEIGKETSHTGGTGGVFCTCAHPK